MYFVIAATKLLDLVKTLLIFIKLFYLKKYLFSLLLNFLIQIKKT